ncbi:WAP four-disulfide core domain protein 3 [Mustelus asterias]
MGTYFPYLLTLSILFLDSTSADKKGSSFRKHPSAGVCADYCIDDSDCLRNQKCCSNGHSCVSPRKDKNGSSPQKRPSAGVCSDYCIDDSDCPRIQKCCSNRCGHSCASPRKDGGSDGISEVGWDFPSVPDFQEQLMEMTNLGGLSNPGIEVPQEDDLLEVSRKLLNGACTQLQERVLQPNWLNSSHDPLKHHPFKGLPTTSAVSRVSLPVSAVSVSAAPSLSDMGTYFPYLLTLTLSILFLDSTSAKGHNSTVIKFGKCPRRLVVAVTKRGCTCDEDCPGPDKCCVFDCGAVCVPPAFRKPGVCPQRHGGVGVCAEYCTDDSDCPDDEKCCSNGCGHSCVSAHKVKSGRCSLPRGTKMCAEFCHHDGDCPAEQKCCKTTCGHACSEPC